MKEINVMNGGGRLDVFLTEYFKGLHTRSQITNSIKEGRTILNNKVVKPGTALKAGDIIIAEIEVTDKSAEPEDIAIDVVFEDEYLMIINKPRGLVVHPGAGNKGGTLLNGLLMRKEGQETYDTSLSRGGLVHRLDKNTAGLMVVAKTSLVQAKLASMFEKHEVKRTYLGLLENVFVGSGTINKNIIRDPNHRTLYKTCLAGGRHAVTHYKVIKNYSKWTLVQFNLETGRTHQIRVHCKFLGHLIVGDPEYNPSSSIKASGQLLESIGLSFKHPVTEKEVYFRVEPSAEFRKVLAKLK